MNFNLHWHSFYYRKRTFRVSLSYVAAALLPYLCHKRRASECGLHATIEVRAFVFFLSSSYASLSLTLHSQSQLGMVYCAHVLFSTYSCITPQYLRILQWQAHTIALTHFAHIAHIVNACYQRSKTSSSSTTTTTRATADAATHKIPTCTTNRTRNISMSGVGR